ncbi:FAD-dependent oxidoreductase [Aliiroseovarius crassostreae]|uniref:FAD-dependent oxidoreductase n=1 Tax=Aliiroseovarius crassostreae TaxID=154981 RepID=UPI002208FE06|nr:FAD-dependent oxidoreductase [Aliiroseovarius crassostreae]UWQ00660.1 FAD-dependent oxidoreductase [Aliiroseovarius crassostreae]
MRSDTQVDVLVIGGGTAGFGAALAAARQGQSTILLEASQKIGGVMAFCPGMPWGAAYPCDISIGGIMDELAERLMALVPPAAEKRPCTLENFGAEIQYDHDIAITTMFDMLEEAGVALHLGATAFRPVMQGKRIRTVECFDRHGPYKIHPRMVIDCSGDGDISAKAGVPYELGDTQGNMMGVTLTFMMVGADLDRVFADPDPYFTRQAAKGIAEGRLHPDLGKLYLMRGFHPDSVFCNSVVIRGVDGTNPTAVNRATQEGRRRCLQMAAFLRRDIPGFEQARMMSLGPTVGVRETRKLEGQYRLTGADLAAGVKFADGIVACDNPIDDVMRADVSMTHDAIVGEGEYYTIPFRALVPKEIKNLMFAGRILSADPTAFASVRGMPQCMAMGQACGTAAALAGAGPVQAVDHAALVAELTAQGVRGLGRRGLGGKVREARI